MRLSLIWLVGFGALAACRSALTFVPDRLPDAAVGVTIEAWCYGTNFAGQQGQHVYELAVAP